MKPYIQIFLAAFHAPTAGCKGMPSPHIALFFFHKKGKTLTRGLVLRPVHPQRPVSLHTRQRSGGASRPCPAPAGPQRRRAKGPWNGSTPCTTCPWRNSGSWQRKRKGSRAGGRGKLAVGSPPPQHVIARVPLRRQPERRPWQSARQEHSGKRTSDPITHKYFWRHGVPSRAPP